MLNNLKQINTTVSIKKCNENKNLFFNLPTLPKTTYLQIYDSKNIDLVSNLKIVLDNKKRKNIIRYNFYSKVFKSFFLFDPFSRKIKKKFNHLLNIFFILKLSKNKISFPYIWIKKIRRGNYRTFSLGFFYFVSKKNFILTQLKNQILLKFKEVVKKKRKTSYARKFRFTFIASIRTSKIKK